MTDNAHDMGLPTFLIHGVAHGLAVNGKTCIFFPVHLIPATEGPVKMGRIDANETIANDGLAGNNPSTLFSATTEAFPGFLAQTIGPIRHRLVAPHTA